VVNGVVVTSLGHPLDVTTDHIQIDGRTVALVPSENVYLMLHKPAGVLSTTSDQRGRPTVIELLPPQYRHLRLYSAGRLDQDSTGLILLTNDGDLVYRLTHPRYQHEKEYRVRLDARLSPADVRQVARGIQLDDGITYPARVGKVPGAAGSYHIVIHEGRKRQVRRMFQHMGYRVLALHRTRIGSLELGSLKTGAVRPLTAAEVSSLRRTARLEPDAKNDDLIQ